MTVKQALKRISKAELARRTGLSKSGISLLLHGHRRGSIVSLRKVAAVLEVGLDALDAYLQKFPEPTRLRRKLNPDDAKTRESVAA